MRLKKQHIGGVKKTWKEDEYRINKHILLKGRALAMNDDIENFHAHLGKIGSYEANHSVRVLSKLETCSFKMESFQL